MKYFEGVNLFAVFVLAALCIGFLVCVNMQPGATYADQVEFFFYKLTIAGKILFTSDPDVNWFLRKMMTFPR